MQYNTEKAVDQQSLEWLIQQRELLLHNQEVEQIPCRAIMFAAMHDDTTN
jgi:hypothetical protein